MIDLQRTQFELFYMHTNFEQKHPKTAIVPCQGFNDKADYSALVKAWKLFLNQESVALQEFYGQIVAKGWQLKIRTF